MAKLYAKYLTSDLPELYDAQYGRELESWELKIEMMREVQGLLNAIDDMGPGEIDPVMYHLYQSMRESIIEELAHVAVAEDLTDIDNDGRGQDRQDEIRDAIICVIQGIEVPSLESYQT